MRAREYREAIGLLEEYLIEAGVKRRRGQEEPEERVLLSALAQVVRYQEQVLRELEARVSELEERYG